MLYYLKLKLIKCEQFVTNHFMIWSCKYGLKVFSFNISIL